MTDAPIRVLCVDDNSDLNSLVALMIDGEPDMESVGVLEDVVDLTENVEQVRPDVTLLDLTIPGCNVLRELPTLTQQLPTRIIVFSGHDDPGTVKQALGAGAAGFVCKHGAMNTLIDAIRQVHAGKIIHPVASGRHDAM